MEDMDINLFLPTGLPTKVCLICLKSIVYSEKHKKGTNDDVLIYSDFLDFCVKYLKIDSIYADILKVGKEVVKQEEGSPAAGSFCEECEYVVRKTLNTFAEWNNLRTILLGNVNRLGLMIHESSKDESSIEIEKAVCSFREHLESKCITKVLSIQPVVQLPSINQLARQNDGNVGEINDDHVNLFTEQDEEYQDHIDDIHPTSAADAEDPSWLPSTSEKEVKGPTNTTRKIKKIGPKSTRRTRSSASIKCEKPAQTEDYSSSVVTNADKRRGRKRRCEVENPLDDVGKQARTFSFYSCSECQLKLTRRSDFLEHNIKEHESIDLCKFLECSVCHKKQTNIIELYNHLKSQHNNHEKSIFCVHCSEAFTTQQLCDLHRRLDHPKCPHILCEVDDCDEKFISVSEYNEHLKSHSSSPDLAHCCEQCGRGFLGIRQHEVHKLYHIPKDGDGFHVCPIQQCVEHNKYRNVSKLANHYNEKHLSKTERLQLHRCELCKKSPVFIFRKELLIHMKIHTKDVQCQFCQSIFKGRNNLKVHQFNKHPDKFKSNMISSRRQKLDDFHDEALEPSEHHSNEDNFAAALYRTCPYCLKRFLKFQDLERHKASEHDIHVIIPPTHVQCEVCGLTLTKYQLPRHMKCHKEPHLPCPHPPCTKKFRREENMIMHIKKVHDRKECDRDFVCDTCGKRYLSRGLLNRHVKEQHIKPFPCHLCPKTFSTIGRVNEHLRASHTNEKFQCKWCPNEYGWLVKLKLHAKKKHPEQAHLLDAIYKHGMKPTTIHYNAEVQMKR